jgi:hypothetical protein
MGQFAWDRASAGTRILIVSSTYSLDGKSVLITGGSIGIGEATALALAPYGCKLALTY